MEQISADELPPVIDLVALWHGLDPHVQIAGVTLLFALCGLLVLWFMFLMDAERERKSNGRHR